MRCRPSRTLPLPLIALLLAIGASPALGQNVAPDTVGLASEAPRIYLDCNRCDLSHVRREIRFVNHVRDPAVAQIHVLVTDEGTGGGGRTYTMAYLGRGVFEGLDHTLTYNSLSTHTSARERDGVTEMLKLGLVPYLARTPHASRLRLSVEEEGERQVTLPRDRWSNWTFELYFGGNFNLEAARSSWNARYGFFADRVTNDWKVRVRPYFNNNVRSFETEQGTVRSVQRRHGLESYLIRSVGDHWGVGTFGNYITNTFDNLRHGVSLAPAVEYSLFPYEESSRRQITLAYRAGVEAADYFEETIYGKTSEALAQHALDASIQYRQPWGSVSGGVEASSYLPQVKFYRLTFDGRTSFRIGSGLEVQVGGSFQRIHDQLNLPRGDATLQEILLQQRQLATSYRAAGDIGLAYTFGSIYSNVVNPRF